MAKEKKNSFLQAPEKLSVLITIIEREKAQFYVDVLEGYSANLQVVFYGRGTAPKEVRNYFGASENKAVIFSVVKANMVKEIMKNYEEKYFKTKKGKGIAMAVPMSSLIGVSLYRFLAGQGDED